jgi:hypothetical protein
MKRKSQARVTQKTQKAKPATDPLQKKMLDRFITLESLVSPFWSLRYFYHAAK